MLEQRGDQRSQQGDQRIEDVEQRRTKDLNDARRRIRLNGKKLKIGRAHV